jgi:hypothetical protein
MKLETALRGSAFDHSLLHLKPKLDCLSRQPFCSKAFVVCMEFWLGLAVRYRLPRRKWVESPSLEFVRNLLLSRPLRLDHLLFPFSPNSTRRRMARAASGGVRDLSLTVARSAIDGINFAIWLHWLIHDWVARSIAGGAHVLFDFWRHIEPFMWPDWRPCGTVE